MFESYVVGTIVMSAPEYGIALVVDNGEAPRLGTLYVGRLPYQDGITGVIAQEQLTDGASVLCVPVPGKPHNVFIIGPANDTVSDPGDPLRQRAFYNICEFMHANSNAFDWAITYLLKDMVKTFQNRAHAVDMDALPGDYDLADRKGGAGIHVGRQLVQLRGAPTAFVDASGVTNTVRQVGKALERHTLTTFDRTDSQLAVHDMAVSVHEGMGKDSPGVMTPDMTLGTLVDDYSAAVPYFRMQQAEGSAIDGKEEQVLGGFEGLHTPETQPQVLSKRRVSLLGERTEASVSGLASVKTPVIRAIQQLGYGEELSQTGELLVPYAREKQQEPQPAQVNESDRVDDAVINRVIDKLLTGDYLEKLLQAMAAKGLKVSTGDGEIADAFKDDKPIGGASAAQEYPLPKSIELTDPVTGKKARCYNSTSCIGQEPDGSILITDGYGSEIRMSRGNIYISPALDLIMRPGRDMCSMVPRHLALNSQETMTLSTAGNGYVHAAGDLKMAGATKGRGAVVLESKATSFGTGDGLVLKSASNASFTGLDVFVGVTEAAGLEDYIPTPQVARTVVIDAGKGTLLQRSRATTIDTEQFLAVASGAGTGSAFSLAPASAALFTPGVLMPSVLSMPTMKGVVKATVLRDGKEEEITLKTANKGTIQASGGGVFVDGAGTAEKGMPPQDAPKGLGDFVAMSALVSTSYRNSFVAGNEFSFPDSYDIQVDLRVPGMLWQAIATDSYAQQDPGYMWAEPYVKGLAGKTTACYPGFAVWEGATVSVPGYKTLPLKKSYVTNRRLK